MDTHIDGVRALLVDVGHGAHPTRVHHDLVLGQERVLIHEAKDVSPAHVVANFDPGGDKVPPRGAVERGRVDPAGDVDRLGQLGDGFQGTLDPVVDVSHQTYRRTGW